MLPGPCPRPIVTRFAPSPTGYLHIGSARTALFCWAFARNTGGKFLLRIEDTDRERSTEAAVQAIFDGLTWLGLDWDGEPIDAVRPRRAPRRDRQRAAGRAARPTTATARRRNSRRCARRPAPPASRRATTACWRDRDPSEAPAGVAPVIRIKAPQTGEIVVNDHVQGKVVFKAENLDDFIILRSDGTPTYMLAVVVDDHDMGVTHIIRGDDHLTNAARQIVIYNGMGWDVPEMAHIPLIHGPDGAKLSQAPRRARRRRLSADGLPARGDEQLPRAPRLVARRRRALLDRADGRVVLASRGSTRARRASIS